MDDKRNICNITEEARLLRNKKQRAWCRKHRLGNVAVKKEKPTEVDVNSEKHAEYLEMYANDVINIVKSKHLCFEYTRDELMTILYLGMVRTPYDKSKGIPVKSWMVMTLLWNVSYVHQKDSLDTAVYIPYGHNYKEYGTLRESDTTVENDNGSYSYWESILPSVEQEHDMGKSLEELLMFLTAREYQIARMRIDGSTFEDIAKHVGTSKATIHNRWTNDILPKLKRHIDDPRY